MKNICRRISFNEKEFSLKMCEMLKKTIGNPFEQLSVTIEAAQVTYDTLTFLSQTNYVLNTLNCSARNFLKIIKNTRQLTIKNLKITIEPSEEESSREHICDGLHHLADCESLQLEFINSFRLIPIPYLKSLRSFSLYFAKIYLPEQLMLGNYASSLQRLSLVHCDISDVAMFGSIPYLELSHCEKIVDISSLNNNDHIIVHDCGRIHDYSRSFAKSRRIEILLNGHQAGDFYLEMSRWSQVEYLKMACNTTAPVHHLSNNLLPVTVRKCILLGRFVASVDFTVTSDHVLTELKLGFDYSIQSLEGYELDKVAMIECDYIRSLQTLEGLGTGKNRKVCISCCDNIKDFSPLQKTPIVEINCCSGFSDPLQLRLVDDLTIIPVRKIDFQSELFDHDPYRNIRCLHLSNSSYVQSFDGLEKIPFLYLCIEGFSLIKSYLEHGRLIENRRLEFEVNTDILNDLFDVHNQFLNDHYYYDINTVLKTWIWSRREKF